MKKFIITVLSLSSSLVGFTQDKTAQALWNELTANSDSKVIVTSDGTSNTFSGYDYLWLKSGKRTSNNILGSAKVTIIGSESDSPTFGKNSFLGIGGEKRAYMGTWLGFSSVENSDLNTTTYVYNGTFTNKFSAINFYNNSAVRWNDSNANGLLDEAERNKLTGSMIIYGGTFNSDITGLGMISDGGYYTANTNIVIAGSITNGAGMGVYGGISGQTDGFGHLFGNTNITVSSAGKTSYVVGGNRRPSDLIGNSTVNISGTVFGIIGGNYINDLTTDNAHLTSKVDGNININIDGGTVKKSDKILGVDKYFSGIIGGGVNTNVTGDTTINIKGNSSVTAGIVGGNAGWNSLSMKNATINISGGVVNASGTTSLFGVSINDAIYGGSLALGINGSYTNPDGLAKITITSSANLVINEGTAINVSGGNITGNIFGGGYALGTNETYSATATVNGGTAITVDAKNALSINGNI
ncbi:MAG: hypothetical protein J6B07_02180, partial [Opitutales bacterium]|nr:hypothetical protein [Opitutales bacterium]